MIFRLIFFTFLFAGVAENTHASGIPTNGVSVDSLAVIIFLSETCPICQQATPAINDLYETYGQRGIEFTGVFPNKGISNLTTIQKFKKKYRLTFGMIYDPEGQWKKELKATITPEIFIIHKYTRQIYYRGRIDNRYAALGKRRSIVTEFYAEDALKSLLEGRMPELSYTEAIGCFIADE